MSMLINFVVSFLVGAFIYFVAFKIGFKHGEQKGMEKFISILKVYNKDLVNQISETLHAIDMMSDKEKEKAFHDYIEKYMGGVSDK